MATYDGKEETTQIVTGENTENNNDNIDLNSIDSALIEKIIKQVEFYFGDKNLPKDKFLLRILHQEGNDEEWVPIDVIGDFNRLKKLTTSAAVLTHAIRQSTSGLLEVNSDNTKVRRITKLPEGVDTTIVFVLNQSIYAKGFPLTATIDDLEEFFEGFGKINLIKLRNFPDGKFKGSVFVEFADPTVASEFTSKENINFKDAELLRLMKSDYHMKKLVERDERKQSKKKTSKVVSSDKNTSVPLVKGALLKLQGIPEGVKREDLSPLFNKNKDIAFIDFNMGQTVAIIRFSAEDGAKIALENVETDEGVIKFNGVDLKYSILEGMEEKEAWDNVVELMILSKNKKPVKRAPRNNAFSKGKKGRFQGKNSRKRYIGQKDFENKETGIAHDEGGPPKSKHARLDPNASDDDEI